jgi:hypothetical protein
LEAFEGHKFFTELIILSLGKKKVKKKIRLLEMKIATKDTAFYLTLFCPWGTSRCPAFEVTR